VRGDSVPGETNIDTAGAQSPSPNPLPGYRGRGSREAPLHILGGRLGCALTRCLKYSAELKKACSIESDPAGVDPAADLAG